MSATSSMGSLSVWQAIDQGGDKYHSSRHHRKQKAEQYIGQGAQNGEQKAQQEIGQWRRIRVTVGEGVGLICDMSQKRWPPLIYNNGAGLFQWLFNEMACKQSLKVTNMKQ